MIIQLQEITARELVEGYEDGGEAYGPAPPRVSAA